MSVNEYSKYVYNLQYETNPMAQFLDVLLWVCSLSNASFDLLGHLPSKRLKYREKEGLKDGYST